MIVSGLRIKTYAPQLARMPTLLALANLKFTPFSITRTCGYLARMNSTESSVDPLSDTITSNSEELVVAKIDCRQSEMTLRSFQHKITIESFILSSAFFIFVSGDQNEDRIRKRETMVDDSYFSPVVNICPPRTLARLREPLDA